MKFTPPPDWSKIFKERPDLESPGYQETLRLLREKTAEVDPIKLRMERIHKERQAAKNKARRKPSNREKSAMPDSVNPLLSVDKRRGKNR